MVNRSHETAHFSNQSKAPKLLVADDDRLSLESLAELLALNGFEVYKAQSGEQAWELFLNQKPDLVITDILMPGLDGIGLLKLIRDRDNIIPVIMITGFGEVETTINALRLGASDFLLKPINAEIMISTVQRGLEHYRLKLLEIEYTQRLEAQVENRTRELARTNEFLRGILESSRGVSIVVTGLDKKVLILEFGS